MRTIAVLLLLSAAVAAKDAMPRVPVFVGTTESAGFVDVDKAVLGSIADLQGEVKKSKTLRLAATEAEAVIVVRVHGRGVSGSSGAVGVPIGTLYMTVPLDSHQLDATMIVGSYSKPLVVSDQGGHDWKHLATLAVRDMEVWVKTNQAALTAAAAR